MSGAGRRPYGGLAGYIGPFSGVSRSACNLCVSMRARWAVHPSAPSRLCVHSPALCVRQLHRSHSPVVPNSLSPLSRVQPRHNARCNHHPRRGRIPLGGQPPSVSKSQPVQVAIRRYPTIVLTAVPHWITGTVGARVVWTRVVRTTTPAHPELVEGPPRAGRIMKKDPPKGRSPPQHRTPRAMSSADAGSHGNTHAPDTPRRGGTRARPAPDCRKCADVSAATNGSPARASAVGGCCRLSSVGL